MTDLIPIRIVFVLILAAAAWFLQPFGLAAPAAAGVGVGLGLLIVVFEVRLKQVSLKRLIGAAVGSVLGILGALMISVILSWTVPDSSGTVRFIQLFILMLMSYVGLVVGATKGDMLNLAALGGCLGERRAGSRVSRFWTRVSLLMAE